MMRVVVGADHRGYELKDEIAAALKRDGHEVLDVGTNSADSVDYPDYARAVGGAIVDGRGGRGGIVCGGGACAAAWTRWRRWSARGGRPAPCGAGFSLSSAQRLTHRMNQAWPSRALRGPAAPGRTAGPFGGGKGRARGRRG